MSEAFLNNDILYFKNLIKSNNDFSHDPQGCENTDSTAGAVTKIPNNDSCTFSSRLHSYHTNQVYDSIRDFLMEDYSVWNQYKYIYHKKKYYAYLYTVEHTAPEYRQEYLQRFSREFKRAQDLGELDFSLFSPEEQEHLQFIMKEPNRFYRTYYQSSGVRSGLLGKLKSRLKNILGK